MYNKSTLQTYNFRPEQQSFIGQKHRAGHFGVFWDWFGHLLAILGMFICMDVLQIQSRQPASLTLYLADEKIIGSQQVAMARCVQFTRTKQLASCETTLECTVDHAHLG